MVLERLKEVKDLRKIWPHEALDFTPWLADEDNISILADAVGLDISIDETESSVGSFNVDIFATENGTGRKIIIENQLEDTNHDHLGKLITYASGKEADIIIWVVKRARDEHKAAVEWLNNHTDSDIGFFLCEIKLYQIADSDIAVVFEVIEKPNEWTKGIKKYVCNDETKQKRLQYWESFNSYAFQNPSFNKLFNKRKESTDHWMTLAIGRSNCWISLTQQRRRNAIGIELGINDDTDLYNRLFAMKDEIEKNIGASFEWLELPERKSSKIVAEIPAELDNTDKQPEQFDWLLNMAIKMKKEFGKYI